MAGAVARRGIEALYSYAGRTRSPVTLPIPTRIGGFGGAEGLQHYLQDGPFTHVVDATHPFAAKMSWNAAKACAALDMPLLALTRPPWDAEDGDDWHHVPDMAEAFAALSGPAKRVFLAIGKMEVARFAKQPQHHYLLRLVDPPKSDPPLPDHAIVVAKGPFTLPGDTALLQQHGIDMIVAKNAGGSGARAKIDAARALGLPVLMIDRPAMPDRTEVSDIDAVLNWIDHNGTERGV